MQAGLTPCMRTTGVVMVLCPTRTHRYTVAFIASNLSGTVADGLLARGWSLRGVRTLMQTTAFAGPALALTVLCVTTTVSNSVAVFLSCAALGGC